MACNVQNVHSMEVVFGGQTYRLMGCVLRHAANYYTIIVRSGLVWLEYNDTSVRYIADSKVMFSNEIWSKLYIIAYVHVRSDAIPVVHMVPHSPMVEDNKVDENCNEYDIPDISLDHEAVISSPIKPKKRRLSKDTWVPILPEDISKEIVAAQYIKLEVFDPLLRPEDVPGAILPDGDLNSLSKSVLERWLECRGISRAGKKKDLIDRITFCIDSRISNIIVPSVDNYKWHNQIKIKYLAENPDARHPLLPLTGWGTFPSVDIPHLFNWGHAHVYLIENAPNWSSAFDEVFSDSDEEILSQDLAECVGQTNIARKGTRFLDSRHILDIMDTRKDGYYFVKARVQASMKSTVYFTTVTMRVVSGSIQECTCNCKQRALGRCSHVGALLLFLDKHTQTKGY